MIKHWVSNKRQDKYILINKILDNKEKFYYKIIDDDIFVFYITPEYLRRVFDRIIYTGDYYVSFNYKDTHYFELISKIPKKILIKMYSSINNRYLFYD
jgi:hypothetical protein